MLNKNALLPERHPNLDFFTADIFDSLPIKNDRHTMEYPFFTLSTKKDLRSVKYDKDGINITISPAYEYGLPTMFDKDILLYLGSIIIDRINKGEEVSRTVRFSCHDLLATTNRHTNNVGYKMLKNAFERLKGCSVSTNIETNGIKYSGGFGLIDDWHIIEKNHQNKRMVRVEATISQWYYNALMGIEVLTIPREYFRLRKSLERRLYEISRKHCGQQKSWKVSLQNLHNKSGSQSLLKKFRFQIRNIITNDRSQNHFPDYHIYLGDDDIVTFTPKTVKKINGLPISTADGNQAILKHIRSSTFDNIRKIIAEANTGWSYNAIIEQFCDFVRSKGKPDNHNGALIKFTQKKVKVRP